MNELGTQILEREQEDKWRPGQHLALDYENRAAGTHDHVETW